MNTFLTPPPGVRGQCTICGTEGSRSQKRLFSPPPHPTGVPAMMSLIIAGTLHASSVVQRMPLPVSWHVCPPLGNLRAAARAATSQLRTSVTHVAGNPLAEKPPRRPLSSSWPDRTASASAQGGHHVVAEASPFQWSHSLSMHFILRVSCVFFSSLPREKYRPC